MRTLDIVAAADVVPLHVVQGADLGPLSVYVVEDDGSRCYDLGAGDVPIDLTGCAAFAQVRRRPSDTTPMAVFAVAITPLDGLILVHMTAAVTATLTASDDPAAVQSRAVWDLVLVEPNGRASQLVRGPVYIYKLATDIP